MTSVHRPHLPDQISPVIDQASNLLRFPMMMHGDVAELADLVLPEVDVGFRSFPSCDHSPVSVQSLPALDDALVGLFGGHGERVAEGRVGW